MDTDPFLNLLSPALHDVEVAWHSHSDEDFNAEHSLALAWFSGGFFAGGAQDSGADAGSTLSTIMKRRIAHNASEYTSVLKLSDIASALHSFSRPAGEVGSTRAHIQKLSPTQSCSSVPCSSPSLPDLTSNAVFGSDTSHTNSSSDARAINHATCNDLSGSHANPSFSFDVGTMSHSSCLTAINWGLDTARRAGHGDEIGCESVPRGDGCTVNVRESSNKVSNELKSSELESSSKVRSEDMNGHDHCDDENDGIDTDEDETEYVEDEDSKSSVYHVRIIRRPNSNCGQKMMLPSKRMKFTHVKVEATSSCEMAHSLEEEEGGGDLKQIRKEGMSQREVHILSERQRRKSMRESFSILQSLVPRLKLKHTDRITFLTEVITYIQTLRGTLQELERKKAGILHLLGMSAKTKPHRRHAHTPGTVTYVNTDTDNCPDDKAEKSSGWSSLQNGELVAVVEVTVRMCGTDVFITLNTPRWKGVWSRVLSLLQRYSVDILNSTLASSGDSSFHWIHGKATNMSDIEGVDLQEKLEGVIVKELRRRSKK